jgi:uroporphyrinogen decarboxylase
MKGEIPDCLPVCLLSFQNAARFAGMSVGEYCQNGKRMAEAQLAYWEEFRHDIIDIENGIAAMAEAVGCLVEYPENEPPWIVKPALDSLENVEQLPDVDPFTSPSLAEFIKATGIVARELSQTVCIRAESDQGPFSLAAEILGTDKFLMALRDPEQTENVHKLLAYAEDQIIKLAHAQTDAGSHYTMIGDSLAGPDVCSPADYRKYAFPYEKSLVNRLKKEGIGMGIHICGNATAIVGDMVETGAPYLELDHKIDRDRVRRITDGRVTLFGTIDPSTIMSLGSVDEVEENAKEDIMLLGRNGRYVLSPGCTLPYNTPFENVRVLVETGRHYGRYGKDGKLVCFPKP